MKIWLDGKLVDESEAKISVFDHGLLYGDGVFEGLSDDIFHAIIDIVESDHACGFERVKAVVTQAATVDVSGNALSSVSTVRERQGICHQLANDDRLTWVK